MLQVEEQTLEQRHDKIYFTVQLQCFSGGMFLQSLLDAFCNMNNHFNLQGLNKY